MIYVAEVNSGKVAVYGMPFNKGAFNQSAGLKGAFTPLYVGPFRQGGIVR